MIINNVHSLLNIILTLCMNGLSGLKHDDIVVFNYPQVSGCIALRSTMCCGAKFYIFYF